MHVRRGGGPRYNNPDIHIGRSQFDLTSTHTTTFNAGNLCPVFTLEVYPGDTITMDMASVLRIFSPLEAPIMDDIFTSIDFWYVPNRLTWDNWEAFLGAHDDAGAQDTTYTVPGITGGTVNWGTNLHYMGVPSGIDPDDIHINALPLRAYGIIYDEFYRDQNLVDSINVPTNDSATSTNSHISPTPYKSAKRHDYFTAALPYLQKGTAQTIPFDNAPIIGIAATDQAPSLTPGTAYDSTGSSVNYTQAYASTEIIVDATAPSAAYPNIAADLSSVAVSINALREATAIQRLLEKDARGGTRSPELIRAHFGVEVPDFRVQRPEFLGGGSGLINVSPVTNNSATATEDQGELRGIGTGTLHASWGKSFVEHGWVIGILRARGAVTYHQGIERSLTRQTKYDYYWPELAMLGEQPIYNKEIYAQGTAADDLVFGYQERYADLRYKKSLISGKFDPAASGSLSFWHLSEDFSSLPSLNQTFIEDATPMSRIQTVSSEPDFIINMRFDTKAARPMPVRSIPSLMSPRF